MPKGKTKNIIYGCQKQQLNHLSKKEYIALKTMCHLAKNLYNVELYNIRQYYFQEQKYLSYESSYYLSKDNENYKLLNSNMPQRAVLSTILCEFIKPL